MYLYEDPNTNTKCIFFFKERTIYKIYQHEKLIKETKPLNI